ncbi:hypothetical protein [Actinoplanes sp. NPDC049681]|uniref:hypothetical protein n=1 Tax=Actinoplanes sp. NPDC049681 TaxID=3363905 RepID=UPI0037ACC0B7
MHASGRHYRFQQAWTGAPHPACPPQLRALVQPGAPPADRAAAGILHRDRYTHAALDGELQRIAQAPQPVFHSGQRIPAGGRNNAVHLAAFRLGQLAARGDLDDAGARRELIDAAVQVSLSRTEGHRTVDSGWRGGRRRPR